MEIGFLIEQVLRGRDPRRVIAEALLQEEGDPGAELTHRVHTFLQATPTSPDYQKMKDYGHRAKEMADWFATNFTFLASRTPTGMKDVKERAVRLHQAFVQAVDAAQNDPKYWETALRLGADHIKDCLARLDLPRFVAGFSRTESVPAEAKVGANHYVNDVGLSAGKFKQYVDSLESLWGSLQGWRRKALDGGLTIILAGPSTFRGTSAGKYNQSGDRMFVRATPNVLRRSAGTYGSPDYILVHELGHRFEHKHRPPVDFDRQEWWTTPYSRTESLAGSEPFAELFALGHYGGFGKYQDTLDRFEKVMS